MTRQNDEQRRRLYGTAGLLVTLAFVPLWVGCGTTNDRAKVAQAIISPTTTNQTNSQIPASHTPNYKEAAETEIAQTRIAMVTIAALTAAPTVTRGWPPPQPTNPPVVGVFWADGILNRMTHGRKVYNYWQGWINGELVQAQAGYKVEEDDPQPRQGTIVIIHSQDDPGAYYLTPSRVGEIAITSVNGTLLSIGTLDGRYAYTFDLVSHVWNSATPEPLPTIWTPSPQVSPLSTSPANPQ